VSIASLARASRTASLVRWAWLGGRAVLGVVESTHRMILRSHGITSPALACKTTGINPPPTNQNRPTQPPRQARTYANFDQVIAPVVRAVAGSSPVAHPSRGPAHGGVYSLLGLAMAADSRGFVRSPRADGDEVPGARRSCVRFPFSGRSQRGPPAWPRRTTGPGGLPQIRSGLPRGGAGEIAPPALP
jgi:hypothetical protein